jgi:hypothetical protein
MNIVSKKLHALEKNVLPELPEEGTTKITWENGDIELDRAENELHRRATQILQAHAEEMQEPKNGEKPLILRCRQATKQLWTQRTVALWLGYWRFSKPSQMLL